MCVCVLHPQRLTVILLSFPGYCFVLLHKAHDGPGSQLTSSVDIHLFQVLCVIVGR